MLHRIKLTEFNTMEMVELEGLSVVVDRVVYQSDMVTPEDRPHCFAYFLSLIHI